MLPARPTRKPTNMSDNSSIKRFKEEQAAELQKRMEKKKREQEAEEKRLAQEEEDRKKAEVAAKEQQDQEDAEKAKAAAQKKLKGGRKSGGGRKDVRKVRPQTAEEKRKELQDGVLQAGECFCFRFLKLTFSIQILAPLARSGANPAT